MCTTGSVPSVTISSVTNDTVIFFADAKLTTATSHSPDNERRILGTFVVARSAVQPTPIQQAGGPVPTPAVALQPGAVGVLYLEVAALRAPGKSALGPCFIRGAVPPFLPDENAIALKWPDCGGPIDDRHKLSLTPKRFTVTGYVGEKPPAYTVDLLDPSLALPGQEIHWSGSGPITLALTKAGFHVFQAPPDDKGKLQVWPISMEIIGMPEGGYLGKIELRDETLAWPTQSFGWKKPGDTITIEATELGCNHFGVFSDSFIAAAKLIEKAEPQLREAFTRAYHAHCAMERWTEKAVRVNDSAGNHELKKLLSRLGGHL